METIKLLPYTLDTELTGYMPIPRELLEMDLPSTAVLIYGALLDRGTLSRKNAYTDGDGWVYVFYPVERQTDYAREQIFHIIDGRYLSCRPLIVTTNLSLQELKHPKDLAQARICDRILELCVPVCFDGESLRQDRAKERMRLYKEITAS